MYESCCYQSSLLKIWMRNPSWFQEGRNDLLWEFQFSNDISSDYVADATVEFHLVCTARPTCKSPYAVLARHKARYGTEFCLAQILIITFKNKHGSSWDTAEI